MKTAGVAQVSAWICRYGNQSMRKRLLAEDWTQTSLGALDQWPHALQALVNVMFDSAQPMFVAWGADRTLIYNDAYISLLGPKHSNALGRPFFEVWSEAAAAIQPLFDRVFEGESVVMDDIRLTLNRDQGPADAHFAFSYTPVRALSGEVEGLFCACQETTRDVLSKQLDERNKTRLAQMFEKAPSFIAMLEGPEHRFTLANARYKELVGDRPLIGLSVADALPEAVAQGYLDLLDSVFVSGRPVAVTSAKFSPNPMAGAPISERFLDFVYQPITDDAGQVTGIFVDGTDVTERVLAEDAVRKSELRLREANASLEASVAERTAQLFAREALIRTFYEHSSECHAVLEQAGDTFTYQEINPATLSLYGKTREEVIGLTTETVLGADLAPTLNKELVRCLQKNGPVRYERLQGKGVVEAIATPVPITTGAARQIVVSARDVTERRSLEQQLAQAQKMEAVGQLTGGLAHDFNNLLAGMTGSLELMRTRMAQGRMTEIERYLDVALGAGRRAASLTQRLLAFSRRQTLDPKVTDVNRLVVGMEELLRRTIGPSVVLEVVGTVGLWATLVDPAQLENALLNLCLNARDAMPDGGRLTIETGNKWLDDWAASERDMPPGQYISICVSDTGVGMPPEIIKRAFDPFFTTKPTGEGTGLGLSMIYGFAQQSGGQVRIYSEVGHGTTVCIYLPRNNDSPVAENHESADRRSLARGDGEVVLVIDDEPSIRMLISEVLDEAGYTAIEVGDGPAGLRILQSNARIDLLITDVGLPGGLNGRQVADAARVLRPELKVLFITGYAENAVISHRHLENGMHLLTKPFPIETLRRRVREIIEEL
jgi:PAS domain S-box-containing protein